MIVQDLYLSGQSVFGVYNMGELSVLGLGIDECGTFDFGFD